MSIAMTYGLPVRRIDDPLVDMAEKHFTDMTASGAPGKYFVNILPALKHVPDWVPGIPFKQAARKIRERMFKMIEEPYQGALELMVCPNFNADLVSLY